MWLIVCEWVYSWGMGKEGREVGMDGGREEESKKKGGEEEKTFPTVILSSVDAAQFIHSNGHKQKTEQQNTGTTGLRHG